MVWFLCWRRASSIASIACFARALRAIFYPRLNLKGQGGVADLAWIGFCQDAQRQGDECLDDLPFIGVCAAGVASAHQLTLDVSDVGTGAGHRSIL